MVNDTFFKINKPKLIASILYPMILLVTSSRDGSFDTYMEYMDILLTFIWIWHKVQFPHPLQFHAPKWHFVVFVFALVFKMTQKYAYYLGTVQNNENWKHSRSLILKYKKLKTQKIVCELNFFLGTRFPISNQNKRSCFG